MLTTQLPVGPLPTAIVDLELSTDAVIPLGVNSPLYVIVRVHGVPLGVVIRSGQEPAAMDLLPIVDRLVDHLVHDAIEVLSDSRRSIPTLLAHEHSQNITSVPTLTVAVCTRNRPADLEVCLEHLASAWPSGAELLVVDNAPSTNSTERLVKERFPWVRYVSEHAVGLNRARNKAIAESAGQVIAFTDDDVRVEPGWVSRVQEFFARNPEVSLMTGLVLPFEFHTDAQWLFEVYGGFGRGFERRWLRSKKGPDDGCAFEYGMTGTVGTGANMAFRRSVFGKVGLFDPALDAGTATQGAGDLEMFFRVLKFGYTVCYNPEAVVRHRHRQTHEDLAAQIGSWGTGVSAYLTRSIAHFPEERWPIMLLRMHRFVNWFVPRAISMLSRHPQTFKLLLRELRGSFAGPKLYRRSQAEAVKLGDAFPVALRAGSKTRRARESADKVTREIDLAKVDDALVGLVGAEHVRLLVRAREQFVGEVTIAVHDESVGLDRLHDAIAIAFGTHFLAIDLDKARRESLAIVKKRFGNL